jgi:hypothetical protein
LLYVSALFAGVLRIAVLSGVFGFVDGATRVARILLGNMVVYGYRRESRE